MLMNKKLIIVVVVIIQMLFIWRCILAPADKNGLNPDEKQQEIQPQQETQLQQDTEENFVQVPENEQTDELLSNSLDFIQDFQELILEGQKPVTDTPWGINAGVIELEEGEKVLLLTPNTGVMTQYMSIFGKKLRMTFCIYKEVRNMSDGAGLLLQIHDGEGNLIKEENIAVDAELDWQTYECDLSDKSADGADIRIVCNNGGNDDDACDWVIIRDAVIE